MSPTDYLWLEAVCKFSGLSKWRTKFMQTFAANNDAPIDALFQYTDGTWCVAHGGLLSMGPDFIAFVKEAYPSLYEEWLGWAKDQLEGEGQ